MTSKSFFVCGWLTRRQIQAEERIAKRLKQSSGGSNSNSNNNSRVFESGDTAPMLVAVAPSPVEQSARDKSITYLENAIRANLAHFQKESEEAAAWAVKEEHRIYQDCRASAATYRARIISLGSGLRKKKELYVFQPKKKKQQ